MSDSYDMAVSRSRDLFLRSRLELAAAHVLFLPSCLVRDAGLGLVRGNMLALLFGSTETRVGGQLRKVGGIRSFVSQRDGYGDGGVFMLLCACTVLLPLTALYAVARAFAACADAATQQALSPEALLSPPDDQDEDEWLGRLGEIERMLLLQQEAVQQSAQDAGRELRAQVDALSAKVDANAEQLNAKLDLLLNQCGGLSHPARQVRPGKAGK